MTSQGGVFVSQEQIYDEVLGMKDGLSRVESLLEKHIALEEQRNEGVEVRLENHGTRLGDLGHQVTTVESRLSRAESDIRTMKEQDTKKESRKAPWWTIVAAVTGIIAGVGALGSLFILLTNISQALTHLP